MTSKLFKKFFQVQWKFLVFSNYINAKIYEFPTPEAVAQRGSVKKVFLKSSQNSPENTCVRASFLKKLKASLLALLLSLSSSI